MAHLSFYERHILRKLVSKGHDQCIACGHYPETFLNGLCEKGLMEKAGDHYRLTPSGREIKLTDLR